MKNLSFNNSVVRFFHIIPGWYFNSGKGNSSSYHCCCNSSISWICVLCTKLQKGFANSLGERRIFWIVAIVCLPMIGNLIFLIVHDALTTRQIPKTDI
jgi:Na+/melibiose symporter-like transporter